MKNNQIPFLLAVLFFILYGSKLFGQQMLSIQNSPAQTQVLSHKNSIEKTGASLPLLVDELDKAKGPADYLKLKAHFIQLTKTQPQNWLPHYYVAFCDVKMAVLLANNPDEAEKYIVQGTVFARKAGLLLNKTMQQKELSEVYTIASMLYRACPSQMDIGQTAVARATEYLHLARRLNPQNPRAVYLDAFTRYYAQGASVEDKKLARQMAEISIKITRTEKRTTEPHWGITENEVLLNQ